MSMRMVSVIQCQKPTGSIALQVLIDALQCFSYPRVLRESRIKFAEDAKF